MSEAILLFIKSILHNDECRYVKYTTRDAFCPELGGERLKGDRQSHRRVAKARDAER